MRCSAFAGIILLCSCWLLQVSSMTCNRARGDDGVDVAAVREDVPLIDDRGHKFTAGAMHGKASIRGARRLGGPRQNHTSSACATKASTRVRCSARDLVTQSGDLSGDWVVHDNPDWLSYYGELSACPTWARDFDCLEGAGSTEHRNTALARQEYAKIFRPHKCDLSPFDDSGFDQCLAGRRLIMVGDSNMNGMFTSLGCLMRERSEGALSTWDVSTMTGIKGEYQSRNGPVFKQVTGEMDLSKGGRVILRGFGRFNLTLWDEVIAELAPITAADVILVNFGAWYHRFFFDGGQREWQAWKADVQELLFERLAKYPATVVWKGHTTFHYAGETGAFTGVQQELPQRVAPLQECQKTDIGEFWFDEQLQALLRACGKPCQHIGILPLFQASLPLHNSHFGTYGRGRAEGEIDCTHFCSNVVDQYNTILYNYLCAAEGTAAR